MKRIICFIALSIPLISGVAAPSYVQPDTSGIIPPTLATGFRKYGVYHFDTNGNMVVCEPENVLIGGKCNKWEQITSKIPKGKTFVGIKHEPKSETLQIWWK